MGTKNWASLPVYLEPIPAEHGDIGGRNPFDLKGRPVRIGVGRSRELEHGNFGGGVSLRWRPSPKKGEALDYPAAHVQDVEYNDK